MVHVIFVYLRACIADRKKIWPSKFKKNLGIIPENTVIVEMKFLNLNEEREAQIF